MWGLFGSEGHNLNKLGRGPLVDLTYIKAQCLVVSDKIFHITCELRVVPKFERNKT